MLIEEFTRIPNTIFIAIKESKAQEAVMQRIADLFS